MYHRIMLLQRLRQAPILSVLGVRGLASSLRCRGLTLRHSHMCAMRSSAAIIDFRWRRRPSCPPCGPQYRKMHSTPNDEILDQQDVEANERTVFVGGLNALSDEDVLKEYFSVFGEVEASSIVRTIRGSSKCFGFVLFKDGAAAEEVLKQEHVIEEVVVNVCRTQKYRVVYIGRLPSNVTSEHLAEHFAKFGEVQEVEIPENTNQRRGYALVTFSTQGEALRATEEANQTIHLGTAGDYKTELKVKLYTLAKSELQTNRILVNDLPYETTAEELRDVFGEMGSLKAVDLALNAKLSKCVAYMTFKNSEDVHDIASKGEIMFKGITVSVHKADAQSKVQARHRSLFIDNLPLDITEEELTLYFMTFGRVRRVSLPLDQGTNHHMGFGVVKFLKSPDLDSVLNYGPHVIGTHKIGVRRLALILPSFQMHPVKITCD